MLPLLLEKLWLLFAEVTLQQALKRLAVTGFVAGHLMHGVVDGVQTQFLRLLGQSSLAGGGAVLGTPLLYQLPAFVLCIFPVGVMAGLLTLRSGSVWPAAFLHAAHNNYDQAVFSLITAGDNRMYFVSETGVLTILCAWAPAAILYIRARKQHL